MKPEAIYRRGFNDSIEGAMRFLELHAEIGRLEQHECDDSRYERFEPCAVCEDISQRSHEQDQIVAKWAHEWTKELLKGRSILPPQIWCKCGHISGQHGIYYPHICATSCENYCEGFEPALDQEASGEREAG